MGHEEGGTKIRVRFTRERRGIECNRVSSVEFIKTSSHLCNYSRELEGCKSELYCRKRETGLPGNQEDGTKNCSLSDFAPKLIKSYG